MMFRISLAAIFFLIVTTTLNAQRDTTETLLEKNKQLTPMQYLIEDTARYNSDQEAQSAERFTNIQDSSFNAAMQMNIPASARLKYDLHNSQALWRLEQEIAKGTPWQVAIQNMQNIPEEAFEPSGIEVTLHQLNIQQSLSIPYARTYSPYGAKINLSTIGRLIGVTKDVSPEINYSLDYPTDVEVVIYSLKAVVIATIFDGSQQAGSYTFTWNGRDDKGRKMPSGDYIGEVRVGKDRYIRKRIVLP